MEKKKTIAKLQKREEFVKSALKQAYFDQQQIKRIEDNLQFLNNLFDHYESEQGATVSTVRDDIESGQFQSITGEYMSQDLIENIIRLMLELEIITEAKNYKP